MDNKEILSKRRHLILPYVLVGIISITIGIYFRLYPLTSFTANDSSEKAAMFVMAKLRILASQQIASRYPNVPSQQKDVLIDKLFGEMLKRQKDNVRASINSMSQNIDNAFSPQQKYPYLLASDSFYYYGLTENIATNGHLGGPIKGSKYLNKKMLAPKGHWEPITLHPFVGFSIYKIMHIFDPSIDLMYAVSFTPLVITFLSLVPFLLICAMLGCRPITSLIASVFFLLAPIFVKRSLFGWYDNDPYSVLFPLLIITFIIYGIKNVSHLKKALGAAIISSILLMFYAMFWQGWVLLFGVIAVSVVLILFANILFRKNTDKNKLPLSKQIIFFSSLLLSGFAFISLAFGINEFFVLYQEGWAALKNFISPQLSSWPDLFISVGELKKSDLGTIVDLLGGWLFFLISIGGLFYSLITSFLNSKKDHFFSVILIAAFCFISIFITFGAQRFAMLCLAPMSIAFALGIQSILEIAQKGIASLPLNKRMLQYSLNSGSIILLLSSVLLPIHNINTSIQTLLTPIYNDTWKKALEKIDKITPKNSIINAWWPPGHFIKATAKRRVSFDGATINFPQAYWLSNVFLSNEETHALGLLRMLNNSANDATVFLQDQGISLSNSIFILNKITHLPDFKARMILKTVLKNTGAVEKLLSLTHKRPDPSYILIYNEFVKNNLQLSFIGNWDFKKIETINKDPELLANVPNRNSKEYVDFLWTLAGGQHKYSDIIPQISKAEDILFFKGNIVVNLKTKECSLSSDKYGKGIPYSLFYRENDKVIEKKFDNANLPFSVILTQNASRHNVVLLDTNIARSLLIQLYFFDGLAYKNITPVIKESDLTKRTEIKVFEIDWEGFEKAIKKN